MQCINFIIPPFILFYHSILSHFIISVVFFTNSCKRIGTSDLDSQTDKYWMNSIWTKKNVYAPRPAISGMYVKGRNALLGIMTLGGTRQRSGCFWGLWPFHRMTTTILPPRRQFVWYDVQSNSVVDRVHPSHPNKDTSGRDVRRVAKTKFPEGWAFRSRQSYDMNDEIKHG